jgi:hypothetical protein
MDALNEVVISIAYYCTQTASVSHCKHETDAPLRAFAASLTVALRVQGVQPIDGLHSPVALC